MEVLEGAVDAGPQRLHALEAAHHLEELEVRARIRALELLPALLLVVLSVPRPLVQQVDGLVTGDILLLAIVDVDLCEVLAVVGLRLGQHAALLIVLEPLLHALRVLVEPHERPLIFIACSEEPDAVAAADDPPLLRAALVIVLLVLAIFLIILLVVVEQFIRQQPILQEVLLLLQCKGIEIYVFLLPLPSSPTIWSNCCSLIVFITVVIVHIHLAPAIQLLAIYF